MNIRQLHAKQLILRSELILILAYNPTAFDDAKRSSTLIVPLNRTTSLFTERQRTGTTLL